MDDYEANKPILDAARNNKRKDAENEIKAANDKMYALYEEHIKKNKKSEVTEVEDESLF